MLSRAKAFRSFTTACLSALLACCAAATPARAQSDDAAKTVRRLIGRDVKVYVTVIDPKTVADAFGKRIGDRFVAIQVTITNRSEDYQFLLHDVSLDLRKIFVRCSPTPGPTTLYGMTEQQMLQRRQLRRQQQQQDQEQDDEEEEEEIDAGEDGCAPRELYELSSLELSLLRGVAEKGQGQDRRNFILRLFRGVGTVAAGLIGVASFGPSYAESVAVFNGPVLSAYMDAFPDYTINQLNRLNDTAWRSNTLVPKQQARVLVAFVPQSMFLTKEQRKQFKDDPTALFSVIDFRRADAVVDGTFITQLEDVPPSVTGVQFTEAELAKFQNATPEVKGFVIGRFLSDSSISIVNPSVPGLTAEVEGTPTDRRLEFTVRADQPVPPGTTLNFQIANENGVQNFSRTVNYQPALPTVTGIDPAEGTQGESDVAVTITGTNFIPGTTRVIMQPGSRVRVEDVNVTSSTTIEAIFRIASNAPARENQVRVANGSGQSAASVTFTVKEAPEDESEP